MTIAQQQATSNFIYTDSGPDYLSRLSLSDDIVVKTPTLDKAWHLSCVLQTTLEVDQILKLFFQEARKLVPCDSIAYCHRPQSIEITEGKQARHSGSYRLTIGEQWLGELTFTRKKKFTEAETMLIEHLICSLVYPLRNALMYKQAVEAALKDPLTGVNNRVAMDATLQREVELAHRYGTPLSLIAMDIDHFKRVNDTYGHAIGDCALKTVANAAVASIRGTDILFRYGGEEFVVLLSNTSEEGALCLAERIRQKVQSAKYICNEAMIASTVSLGVAFLSARENPPSLLSRADQALYQAKAAGRNCVKLA
jgi:diguanylate cyclase (GGDEF)-like protein